MKISQNQNFNMILMSDIDIISLFLDQGSQIKRSYVSLTYDLQE